MDPLTPAGLTHERLLATAKDASLSGGLKLQQAMDQLPFSMKDLLATPEDPKPDANLDVANLDFAKRAGESGDLEAPEKVSEFQEAFRDFVGQTFFTQMIASMRSTQQEPAYFHGGQAEKIFQGQLDQQLSQSLSEKSASKFADPMFHLYQLRQKH